MQTKIISELKRAGLKQKEAQIYAALLELGGAYPSKIAEYTKMNRSTVYKILDELVIKGLVSELQKGKKLYYQIEKPEKLVRYAKSRIRLAKNRLENAKKVLPELEGLFAMTPHKPKVRFYEGLDGVLKVYSDHVDVKESYEMLAFSNASEYLKFIPKKHQREYTKKKEKMNIKTRGIVPDTKIDKKYNEIAYSHTDKKIWPKIRYIPVKMFPYQGEITIYGKDRVSLINFREKAYIGVIIEDQDIHDMMAAIFELSWIGAKEVGE